MALAKKIVKRALATVGYRLVRQEPPADPNAPVPPTVVAPWEKDKSLGDICLHIADRTLVSFSRCSVLYQLAIQARNLPGDVAEVGVYKGGTAYLLGKVFSESGDKPLHLFDTFAGMPEVDASRDLHHKGDFADTSLEGVKAFMNGMRNVSFYQGFFPQTAGPVADRKFCMVHSDVDIYPSAKASCEFFYPRLVPGGVIVFDDYGLSSCPGVIKAVDEFFADKPERVVHMEFGQCFVTKLP